MTSDGSTSVSEPDGTTSECVGACAPSAVLPCASTVRPWAGTTPEWSSVALCPPRGSSLPRGTTSEYILEPSWLAASVVSADRARSRCATSSPILAWSKGPAVPPRRAPRKRR